MDDCSCDLFLSFVCLLRILIQNTYIFNYLIGNPLNGCTDIINCKEISGKIAVLKRGECMFAEKVKRVEDCGSIGAIILDNQPGTR